MMIMAQNKEELANLLAAVKASIVRMYPEMDSEKLLQISRNLCQISHICNC